MRVRRRFHLIKRIVPAFSLIFILAVVARAQEEPKTDEAPTNQITGDTMRAYLDIQEKLHATQLAIERNQQQADAAAARAAESLAARLKAIEQSLDSQRARQDETWVKSNQFMLILTSAFGSIGLLSFLAAAYLHWSASSRLAQFVTASKMPALGMGRGTAGAIEAGELQLPMTTTDAGASQLLATISRLEKRIHELEEAAQVPQFAGNNAAELTSEAGNSQQKTEPDSANIMRLNLLLGKGQSLLHLNKPEEAIACFDEVLSMDPANVEALLKKGSALERLEKLKEAIVCYDRAIEADDSLTIAYLQKGGVFNRLELYSEAQECYEQALRTQEKAPAA